MIYGNKLINSNLLLENDFELSAEEIQNLSEMFSNLNTEEFIIEAASESNIKGALKDIFGSSITSKIDSEAKKTAKEISELFKSDGINRTSKSKAKTIIGKFWEVINILPSKYGELYENNLKTFYRKMPKDQIENWTNFYKALLDFDCYLISWLLIEYVLSLIVTPYGASILSNFIIEPILGQISLQAAIRGGYDKEYKFFVMLYKPIFNIVTQNGKGAIKSAIGNILSYIIQKISSSEKVLKALKIEKESGKEAIKNIGTIIATLINLVFSISSMDVKVAKLKIDKNADNIFLAFKGVEFADGNFKDKINFIKSVVKDKK